MKKTVVLISNYNNYLNSVKCSFKNVIELKGELTVEERDALVSKLEKYDQIILVDYIYVYRYLLQNMDKEFKWIITYDISSLTMFGNKQAYQALMEYYDRRLVKKVAVMDYDFYELLKKSKFNVSKISFDINSKFKKSKGNNIGIVGYDYNPLDNYYNVFTAIKLNDQHVNLCGKTNATKEFVKFFEMKYDFKENDLEVIKSSNVILECSFATLNIQNVLIAMDNGILSIVGNTDIFDKYKTLKQYLVLNSDDNVNEIANKIKAALNHSKEIFAEYKKFRKEYKENSLKQIKEFVEK